jgi:hypothetical protein
MYRRDYILRLIEQFGRILRALRDRILRREIETADLRAELYEIARQAGLDLEVARSLDPRMLLMWVAPTDEVDPARLWLLAELLYLEGLHAAAGGRADGGRHDFERALALCEQVPHDWQPGPGFATAGERTREIRQRLAGGEAPAFERAR